MSVAIQTQILNRLLENHGTQLTPGQAEGLEEFLAFHREAVRRGAFVLRGAAGTGKTFLIRLLAEFLLAQGYKVALLAPTGRAAKVMARRIRRYASTIHRHIFMVLEGGGKLAFRLKDNRDPEKMYYIVDEASMVGDQARGNSNGLLSDLVEFVYQDNENRRLLMVGDPYQLPPVGSSVSPALDGEYLENRFGLTVYQTEIREIMRQSVDSGILAMAAGIRDAMVEHPDTRPQVPVAGFGEVQLVEGQHEIVELYTGLYGGDNLDKAVVLTYSNAMAVRINQSIRWNLFEAEAPLVASDIVMVVRNNYAMGEKRFPFIANGEMGIVRQVYSETMEDRYGFRWVDVDIEFTDLRAEPVEVHCKVVLDLLADKAPQIKYDDLRRLLHERRKDWEELSATRQLEKIRKDPYLNALQIKYGYAVTGHKAQGGQWENVLVVFEPMYKDMQLRDYVRWSYTAVTRAEENLYLHNYPFQPED